MTDPGWSRVESPFHVGELAIQARLGVQAQMDKQGRRVIREYLPPQHRQFFAQLPYVVVGTVDAAGHPWASMLTGQPGFLSTPSDRTLRIAAKPLVGDPLATALAEGSDIGVLGIELHTRRRNRMNGVVTTIRADGFEVQVRQTFGNCPKYIQSRRVEWREGDPTRPKPVHQVTKLAAAERAMIAGADTFFIATAHQSAAAGYASGVDVSHRGGQPGFVRVDGDTTLTIPDFPGNHHFNTFGNLEINPHAGLLVVDFVEGNMLYLTGTAEVIWAGAEISAYAGAERLVRFHLHHGYRVAHSLPLRGSAPEVSPFLAHTGPWVGRV